MENTTRMPTPPRAIPGGIRKQAAHTESTNTPSILRPAATVKAPAELRDLPRWVGWREERHDGRLTKVPYCVATGERASTTDPTTWASLEDAAASVGQYDGRGIVLGGGLVGIDLDQVLDPATDDLVAWAAELVEELSTYTELSPSGTGLHLLLWADLPGDRHRADGPDGAGHVEMYAEGRYFTVTGEHWPGTPAELASGPEMQDTLARVYARLFPTSDEPTPTIPTPAPMHDLTDDELLTRARSAKNGAAFARLFDQGDISDYPSPSEADLALACMLCFWAGPDAAQIERLFAQSALARRDKWQRPDYRRRTIDRALETSKEFYTPSRRREEPGPAPGPDLTAGLREQTDAGNALLIAGLYGDCLRYDHRRERWLVWGGHWWAEDEDNEPLRLALDAAQYRYEEAWDVPEDQQKAAARWAMTSRQNHRLQSALSVAKALRPIADAGEWDTAPHLLGVANGVVDLRTGELLPGTRDQRVTMHTDIAYDPAADAPRWRQFLGEIFPDEDVREFVRVACGYSLTGEIREHAFVVCYGLGANGKSVLLETLGHVLGPYAFAAGFETFADAPAHPEALASLVGRRFVTAAEVRERTRLHEQRLKALSHGDRLSARTMYGKRFEFQPTSKIWLALNHKPAVGDDSLGFWRSVRLIPFEVRFMPPDELTEAPALDVRTADSNLGEKLRQEAPGILAWCVRAASDWYAQGLPKTPAVKTATALWREETDPMTDFLHDCCLVGDQFQATSASLWAAYQTWADEQNIRPSNRLTRQAFGRRLTERFKAVLTYSGGRQQRGFHGVGLQAE